MKTFQEFLAESSGNIKDVSDYEPTRGTQLGSNEGGIHTAPDGSKHYIKYYANPDQARSEVAANKIHQLLGINTLKAKLVKAHNKIGVMSEYNPSLENLGHDGYRKMSKDDAHELGKIYHAAVLTKNWDSIGLDVDNVVRDKKSGSLLSVDHGGAFNFRAQGGHKDFGPDVHEKESLLKYEPSASVYNHAFSKHPSAIEHGLSFVRNLRYDDVHKALKSVGLKNHKELADNLWERRSQLLN